MTRRNITFAFNVINAILPGGHFRAVKRVMLRVCGVKIGNSSINQGVRFYHPNIIIGDNTWIGAECRFFAHDTATISIGDCCDLGPGITFVTGSHELGSIERRAGAGFALPIEVGSGCWLGTCSTLLGGAQLMPGTMIGAQALVLPGKYESGLYAGVPAKLIRDL